VFSAQIFQEFSWKSSQIFLWSESVFHWPTFLNKYRKVWKMIFQNHFPENKYTFNLLLNTIVLPMSVSIFWSWFIPFFLKETGSAVWTMNYEGEMGSSWWQKEWRRGWLMVGDDVFIEQRRNKLDCDWLSFSWITNLELLHFYNLKLWILLINLLETYQFNILYSQYFIFKNTI
jgi:hypothetical protein